MTRLLSAWWLTPFALLGVAACAGVDADGGATSEPLQMGDPGLGTESGNPIEQGGELQTGTESGNPTPAEATPGEQTGTESGNPTRPPPGDVDVTEPAPAVEVPCSGVGAVDGPIAMPVPAEAPTGPMSIAPPPVAGPTEPMPGPTEVPGAVGGPPCEAQACEAEAQQLASTYTQALPAPTPFTEAVCSPAGECSCLRDGIAVVLRPSEAGMCLVSGRLGCVYSAEDYSACAEGEPQAALDAGPPSCSDSCAALFAAQQADTAGFEVTVRASACSATGCRFVLVANDECFVGGSSIAPTEAACELSDDELTSSR